MTRPTLIDLNPIELLLSIYDWNGSWGILLLIHLQKNKREDVSVKVFNMIKGTNESKALIKHISCNCKCKFEGIKCNSNQKCNNDNC